ncbi:hypothetical protein [Actinophytocola sp.]|uniref:hypothetical protein n=1 Tax=Actinophytocola sp. TaxID=1872138 RepID=UPI002ED421C2
MTEPLALTTDDLPGVAHRTNGNPAKVVKRDLDRYYHLMWDALRTVRLTSAEALALGLADSPDPAAAARRKLRRRGVDPVGADAGHGENRYDRAAVEAEAASSPPRPGRPRTNPIGPFVTISLDIDARVGLGLLTPIARALAEVMAAQPVSGTAAVLLESRQPLRDLVPREEWPQYSPAALDQPDYQTWRGWSTWSCDDGIDVHSWIERQAENVPAGNVPIRPWGSQDWRAPSADAALAADELLSRDRTMALLRHLGVRIHLEEWRDAVRDGRAPQPQWVDGRPQWDRAAVTRYALDQLGNSRP